MMTDRSLKRLNNGEMASDMVCPYGSNGNKNTFMPNSRCATLGRVKNLEMTEYQRQKYVNGGGTSSIVSGFFFHICNKVALNQKVQIERYERK